MSRGGGGVGDDVSSTSSPVGVVKADMAGEGEGGDIRMRGQGRGQGKEVVSGQPLASSMLSSRPWRWGEGSEEMAGDHESKGQEGGCVADQQVF